MYEITLIATAHKERGICNSNELYKIIEQISPEIIFEELTSDKFTTIYEGSHTGNLETNTIKRYLQKHPIAHFPVGLAVNELIDVRRFKNDVDKMTSVFNQFNEYQDLYNQHEIWSQLLGFPYLNSNRCGELFERLHALEADIVKMKNREKLSQMFKDWLDIQDRRENEIIKNIYNYSDQNKYNKALILVGAAHRKPIIDKLPTFEKKNKLALNWNLNYFD
ncbi:hypothetical protein [Fodinibius sp.]|uniref:hypothetical protein n=1 Tax=Fodinibius sp. TaxID=1872440 RepID=UPI002ACDC558|nr:hypothetical protein [Fodinibius sp.]MDZ7659492.1 hypothetical protein [Fodinibius sp.]